MKNFKNMLKQAQQMQQKMTEAQEELDKIEVEGSSGAGMVKVSINCKGHMRKISIDKSIVDPEDIEMMEDLIVAAFNDAKTKADKISEEQMGSITSGMPLPGNFKLPF